MTKWRNQNHPENSPDPLLAYIPDRQLALALLTLTGLPFIAARHDSHLARLRVDAREEGILCFLARIHHVDHEPNEVFVAIRDR